MVYEGLQSITEIIGPEETILAFLIDIMFHGRDHVRFKYLENWLKFYLHDSTYARIDVVILCYLETASRIGSPCFIEGKLATTLHCSPFDSSPKALNISRLRDNCMTSRFNFCNCFLDSCHGGGVITC